jgi:putative aldouronate transport system permease protein
MLIPLLKVLCDSFDANAQYGLKLWPREPTVVAYVSIFTTKELFKPLIVSLYTTAMGTFIGLLMVTLGAYVLIQKDMPGRSFFAGMIFFTMLFDGGLVPTYLVIKHLHLINTLWSVILPLAINVYNLILMKSFFQQIPQSLLESAEIDGCSPIGIYFKIVLPLSKPALASIGLFYAVEFWNEFFNFVMYITNTSLYNFQIILREMILDSTAMTTPTSFAANLQSITLQNAAVVVAMIPFIIIYPFCQKYFVKGVTLGAVKG